jgi:hypothetical protein
VGIPGPGRPGTLKARFVGRMMIHRKFGPRGDDTNDYWNGSAYDERDIIWPYWVIGIALVAIIVMIEWIV